MEFYCRVHEGDGLLGGVLEEMGLMEPLRLSFDLPPFIVRLKMRVSGRLETAAEREAQRMDKKRIVVAIQYH